MAFLLVAGDRKGPARYVARPDSPKSYTTRQAARRFPSREAAQREACGNESVTPE